MRFSPWLPTLLLLSLGAYLIPQQSPLFRLDVPGSPGAPGDSGSLQAESSTALPEGLPAETQALFEASRPATVRVESVNPRSGSAGIGTGFFISADGQVLTAYHVVSGGSLFQVNTLTGKSFRARVTAFDAESDVALLQVQGLGASPKFPFLKLTARAPRVGETVLAIGNSGGDFLQPRRGKLLGLQAAADRADFPQGTLEMNAPLAPGDSGGPIIDGNGQAIGVISFIRVDMSGQTRRSYAVPVVEGNALIQALRDGEKRDVPVVGLILDDLHSGVTDPPGAVIARVARNSPAAQAGLKASQYDQDQNLLALGDIITSVNGKRVRNANDFISTVREAQVGDTITLGFTREKQPMTTSITLVPKASVPDLAEGEE